MTPQPTKADRQAAVAIADVIWSNAPSCPADISARDTAIGKLADIVSAAMAAERDAAAAMRTAAMNVIANSLWFGTCERGKAFLGPHAGECGCDEHVSVAALAKSTETYRATQEQP